MTQELDILDQPIYDDNFIVDGFTNSWDRMRHFVIDGGIIVTTSMLIHYQLYKKYIATSEELDYPVGLSILFVIYLGYYIIFETVKGRTLGKMVNKTLVVTFDLERPNIKQVTIRTLLRFPLALIWNRILVAPLHDVFSKTRVIRIKKR